MNAYLILVLLVMPGRDAPMQELQRQMISASSDLSCQAHANKMADAQRTRNAEFIRITGARVVGQCINKGVLS